MSYSTGVFPTERTEASSQIQGHQESLHRISPWIVVCFMCVRESSCVYSYVCVKASCLDDKLVRYLFISVLLGSYHRNVITRPDKRYVMLVVKFVTQVHMSSRSS